MTTDQPTVADQAAASSPPELRPPPEHMDAGEHYIRLQDGSVRVAIWLDERHNWPKHQWMGLDWGLPATAAAAAGCSYIGPADYGTIDVAALKAHNAELEAENAILTEAVAVKMDSAALVESAQKQAIAAGEHAIACGDKAIAMGNGLVAARIHIAELEAEIARLRTAPPRLSATWEHQPDVTVPQPRAFSARALRFGSVAP